MAERYSRLHDTTGVSREEAMSAVDMRPATLADEAEVDSAAGRRTVGTRGDEAGVVDRLQREQHQVRRGPNQGQES